MTILIAECGVNWTSIREALDYIIWSKEAGFDLAKFQLYDRAVIEKIADPQLRDWLESRRLTPGDARLLYGYGKSIGIPVFFTAMYPRAVAIAASVGCRHLKIRMADADSPKIWLAVQGWKGVIFHSTGNHMAKRTGKRVPLFCIPRYPARAADYAPLLLTHLDGRIGASLHAPERGLFCRLVAHGAAAIELHVRADDNPDVIDAAVSVPFCEAKKWIEESRHAHASLDG